MYHELIRRLVQMPALAATMTEECSPQPVASAPPPQAPPPAFEPGATVVAHMTPEDLPKVGRHPFLGAAPLEDIIKLLYRHNQIHQRDVRRLLSQI